MFVDSVYDFGCERGFSAAGDAGYGDEEPGGGGYGFETVWRFVVGGQHWDLGGRLERE